MLHGLNDEEVLESRQKFGDNKIIEAEPETFLDKFKDAFGDPMIKLLLAIACIMAIMAFLGYAEWGELIGIVISVLLVTGISAKTEMSSDNEYRKLKDGTKKELCKVYRNGKIVEIEVDDVVVGDRIIIQSGDKIPADGVLCSGAIAVDNSALNGESEECKKYATPNDFIYREVAITEIHCRQAFFFRVLLCVNGEGATRSKKVGMMD